MSRFEIASDSSLRRVCAVVIAAGCMLPIRLGNAEQLVFTIDPQSSLTGSGYVADVDATATAQDPNDESITTTFSGTITVDVDNFASPTSIEFVSASAVAANSGNWLPAVGGGSEGDPEVDGDADPGMPAPANFGWYLDAGAVGQLYAASRDTVLSFAATPITLGGGEFDPFGIAVTVPEGIYESNVNSALRGDDAGSDDLLDALGANCTDLAGTANRCGGAIGSYSVANDLATLTLPLNFILGEGSDVEVTFTGTFTATVSLMEELAGDYNDNGAVDAADYTVWRDTFGQTGAGLAADGDGDLDVDGADYGVWKTNFGMADDAGATSALAAVPEPPSLALLMLALPLLNCERQIRRKGAHYRCGK